MEVALHLPVAPDLELVAAKAAEVLGSHLGMSQSQVEAVCVATIEACLNAIEHGGEPGFVVRLRGETQGERPRLVVEVEDHGEGFDPTEEAASPSPSRVLGCTARRGWGLTLIRELVDGVQIDSQPGRTVVQMFKYVETE
jgi:serine/threonine-protein kinase RsbW